MRQAFVECEFGLLNYGGKGFEAAETLSIQPLASMQERRQENGSGEDGSNEATARLCGVPIRWNKIVIYTMAGLLTGWGGILMFAHGNSGDPSAGGT